MLHRFPEDAFQQKLQRSQLDYVVSSRAAASSLAENYVGLPLARRLQPAEEVDEATTQLRPLPSIKEVLWNSDIA